jgi:tetratricopeptide (TPR) repeat protein
MATETVQNPVEALDAALARADAAAARGDQEGAIGILVDEIPGKFASDGLAFIRSAEQLGRLNRWDEAEDVLRRGVEAVATNQWLARSYALRARSRGDHTVALGRFAVLRERFPDFAVGHADYIEALIILGQADAAEAAASEAVEAFPGDRWVANAHARAAEARGDAAAALARWQAIRSAWPDHPLGLPGELRALCRLGRYAEASDLLTSANDPQLWGEAAGLAGLAGGWPFAAAWWERFRAARPDDEKGYARGGLALLRSGDAAAAQRLLDHARVRWPGSDALAALQAELNAREDAAPPRAELVSALVEETPPPAAEKKAPSKRGAFGWLGW